MIYKSQFEDVVFPETSLSSFILARLEKYGDKPALIDSAIERTIPKKDVCCSSEGILSNEFQHS